MDEGGSVKVPCGLLLRLWSGNTIEPPLLPLLPFVPSRCSCDARTECVSARLHDLCT